MSFPSGYVHFSFSGAQSTSKVDDKRKRSNPIHSDSIQFSCHSSTMNVIKRIDINHHRCVVSRGKFRQIYHPFAGIYFSQKIRINVHARIHCFFRLRTWFLFMLCFRIHICARQPASLWKLLLMFLGTAITFPWRQTNNIQSGGGGGGGDDDDDGTSNVARIWIYSHILRVIHNS